MTSVTISGGDKLEQYLKELAGKVASGAAVRVGFLEGRTYPGDEGLPVATVAAINNWGAPEKGIPARPFFTQMVENNSPNWGAELATILKAVDFDAEKALGLMGRHMADQLRQSIQETNSPPNSMVTNLLKQRFPLGQESGMTFSDVIQAWNDVAAGETAPAGKPLVWSGTMLRSVDFEVETE